MKHVTTFLFAFFALSFQLQATDYVSNQDGEWRDEPYTWGIWGYPQTADSAYISNAISMSQHEHINDLTVGSYGSINAGGNTLQLDGVANIYSTISNGHYISPTFNWYNGTCNGVSLDVGNFAWVNGNFLDSTIETADGYFSYDGNRDLNNSTMSVNGTFTQGDDSVIYIKGTSSLINNSGTWQVGENPDPFRDSGKFINSGVFNKTSSNHTYVSVSFTDLGGTVKIDDGYANFRSVAGGHMFSNTTFNLAAGKSAYINGDATLKGTLTGLNNGNLVFSGGNFYPTNSCNLNLGNLAFFWTGGYIRNNELTTASQIRLTGGNTRWLTDCELNANGGIVQSDTGGLNIQRSTLTIPSGKTYEIQSDGTKLSYYTSGHIQLNGILSKTGGTGLSICNVPIYGNDTRIQVDTGRLQFSQGGCLDNPDIDLAQNSSFYPSGIMSNAVIYSDISGGIVYDGDDSNACGIWNVTNTTITKTGYLDSYKLYVSPSLTLAGSNSVFSIHKGSIREGVITNLINFVAPANGGNRYIIDCTFHNFATADFYKNGPYLSGSKWYNHTGAVHRIHVDEGLFNSSAGTYYNMGTLQKTAGTGKSSYGGTFIDKSGTIIVDSGTLELTDDYNQFHNTSIQLASNSTFKMSSTITSNLNVTALAPASVWLGENYVQTVNTDITATGPVSFYIYESVLKMTGNFVGSEGTLRWSSRGFDHSEVTNFFPCVIAGSGSKYLSSSTLSFAGGANHTGYSINIDSSSTLNNLADSEYTLNPNDVFFMGDGTFRNYGTIRKIGPDYASSASRFIDKAGTLIVDEGRLELVDPDNEFYDTQVKLASNTTFRMAGKVTSNLTVTATEPATIQTGGNGNNQSINTSVTLNGPVTLQHYTGRLYFNGSIDGAEGHFLWSGGSIYDGNFTNNVPTTITGTATRWLASANWVINKDVDHQSGRIYIQHSSMRVQSGCTYSLGSDGTLLYDNTNGDGYFYNSGTIKKTGGTGITDINARFYNQGGIIGSEIGTLKFNKDLDFTGGGLEISLNSNAYGRVQTTTAIIADDAITVDLADGYIPPHGEEYTILSGSSITGAFTSTNLPTLSSENIWRVQQSSTSIKLTVVSTNDMDGDFMLDSWETPHGLNPEIKDQLENPDGDPCNNLHEYIADTNPQDSNDWFRVANFTNQTIMFKSSIQRDYSLLRCTNLSVEQQWIQILSTRPGVGSDDSMIDTNDSLKNKYYKLKVETQ